MALRSSILLQPILSNFSEKVGVEHENLSRLLLEIVIISTDQILKTEISTKSVANSLQSVKDGAPSVISIYFVCPKSI